MQAITVSDDQAGQRLDKYLRRLMPSAGTGFLYKMLRKKNITLNGKRAEGNELLQNGDVVRFFFSDETFEKFTCASAPDPAVSAYLHAYNSLSGIRVCYEDAHVLILDKPAGILTQRAGSGDDSLNEWMIGYLLSKGSCTPKSLASFKPSVQNRLDRNTSGLVLCGITLQGSRLLSELVRERTLRKFYLTIVKGKIEAEGMLTGYLEKDTAANRVHITGAEEGKPVKTAYRPLAYGEDTTLLEVELITGKTHQIRAHMAGMGHPILGDEKYGDRTFNRKYAGKIPPYQLLHAARVEFPALKPPFEALSEHVLKAPLPDAFREVMSTWQHGIPEV